MGAPSGWAAASCRSENDGTPARLRYAARSESGCVRPGNEDGGFADSHLLMVATAWAAMRRGTRQLDGGGDVRRDGRRGCPCRRGARAPGRRGGSAERTHRRCYRCGTHNQGMGTTVTGLAWRATGGRGARRRLPRLPLRDGASTRSPRTTPTYRAWWIQARSPRKRPPAPPAQPAQPRRGRDPPVEADLSMRETRVGDRYLLCTDGLSGMVADLIWPRCRDRFGPHGSGRPPGGPRTRGRRARQRDRGGSRHPGHRDSGGTRRGGVAGEPQNRPIAQRALAGRRTTRPTILIPAAPGRRRTRRTGVRHSRTAVARPGRAPGRRAGSPGCRCGPGAVAGTRRRPDGRWLTDQWYVAESNGRWRYTAGARKPRTMPLQRLDEASGVPVATLPSYDQTRWRPAS